jgi:hypothetical protein
MSDPARVLRGVAVHREIIADHSVNPDVGCITHCQTCDAEFSFYPCRTGRLVAAIYADRRGYKEEWASK